MKPFHYVFPVLLVAVLAFTKQKDDKQTFQQLSALQGTWVMDGTPGVLLFECWKKVNDTLMQGKSYRLKGIDMSPQESIFLKCTADGIFYTPIVEKQNEGKPVKFKLTSSKENEFVFENPEHDFPKRIVYQLKAKDILDAYVDGGRDGTKKLAYSFQKIK